MHAYTWLTDKLAHNTSETSHFLVRTLRKPRTICMTSYRSCASTRTGVLRSPRIENRRPYVFDEAGRIISIMGSSCFCVAKLCHHHRRTGFAPFENLRHRPNRRRNGCEWGAFIRHVVLPLRILQAARFRAFPGEGGSFSLQPFWASRMGRQTARLRVCIARQTNKYMGHQRFLLRTPRVQPEEIPCTHPICCYIDVYFLGGFFRITPNQALQHQGF